MEKKEIRSFLQGEPKNYVGFDGHPYVAVYSHGERNGLGIGSLAITQPDGSPVREVFMGEQVATAFLLNLSREAP